MGFATNVFVNCPFDEEYRSLLQPLLFTVMFLGFRPRIALESQDSGVPRIERIIALIRDSQYAIHDLSRIKATVAGEYFRLNMPFELGMDFGCRIFNSGKWSRKRCLILEAERYRYQAALSDLSGSDIQVHENKPENVVREVRNWLNNHCEATVSGPTRIWGMFHDFMEDLSCELGRNGHSDEDVLHLPVDELVRHMSRWLIKRPQVH